MRIEDLDEFQGMTPQMVREWLESHGWVQRDYEQRCAMYVDGRSTVCWVPNDFNADTIYGREQRQTMTATMVTLALRENRTVQAMLREINPRMRNGIPSAAAIAAHEVSGGNWLAQSAQKGGVLRVLNWSVSDDRAKLNTLDTSQKIPRDMVPDSWCFWSCDEHGNKVRWPTDAEGKML